MGAVPAFAELVAPWFLTAPPSARDGMLGRPQLSAELERCAASSELTIVEAPAGYGKTTALSAWVHARKPQRTAWLALTGDERAPAALLTGVLAAVMQSTSGAVPTATPRTPGPAGTADPELVQRAILAVVAEAPGPTTLVIDDAHHLRAEACVGVLRTLLVGASGKLRLVLAGSHGLSELFAADLATRRAERVLPESLAFTAEEARQLAALSDRPRDAADAALEQVWRETEGWPVALGFALQQRGPRSGEASPRPGASDRLLGDYVEHRVLAGLRPELRAFVLRAATCERSTARLAGELSGRDDAHALLEECRSLGLFLDAYERDDAPVIYRWHALFARLCRGILRRTDPAEAIRCQLAAAAALADTFPAEAARHALAAERPDRAAEIIESHWLQLIIGGQAGLLAERCARLPEEWGDRPSLLSIRAACLDVEGDRAGAMRLAAYAEARWERLDAAERDRTAPTRAFARLFLAEDPAEVRAAADAVAEVLDLAELGPDAYAHGAFLLGWTELRLRRDPVRAVELLRTALVLARRAGAEVLAGRAAANLAFALAFAGRLAAAEQVLTGSAAPLALESESRIGAALSEWGVYDGGIDAMAAILVAYWRAELAEVLRLARELHAQGGHDSSYAALARVYFALAVAALGERALVPEAEAMLAGVSRVERHGVPWPAYLGVARAGLRHLLGDREGTLRELRPVRDFDSLPLTRVIAADLSARLGHSEEALELLRGIGRAELIPPVHAWSQVIVATIAAERGRREVAHRMLERALTGSAPERILRPFHAPTAATRELLAQHAAWGSAHEVLLAEVLAAASEPGGAGDGPSAALSRREREVFGYLSTRLTAEEIAAELHLSVNTVRSHQRAIYRKLGVASRREAIRHRIED